MESLTVSEILNVECNAMVNGINALFRKAVKRGLSHTSLEID